MFGTERYACREPVFFERPTGKGSAGAPYGGSSSPSRLAKLLASPSLPPPQPPASPADQAAQLEAREEAVKLQRSERSGAELNAVRGQLAACQQKLAQLEAFRVSEKLGLEAEVQARTRGESLMRSRCETAVRERAQLSRTMNRRQQAEARGGEVERGEVRRRQAWGHLAASALRWSRRVLPAAVASWRVNVEWLRLEAERGWASRQLEARRQAWQAEAGAPGGARDVAEAQAEAHRRRAQQGRACRRLGAWVEAQQRGATLRALDRWRAAAAAAAAEEAAAGAGAVVAGNLRTARWRETEQAKARGDAARELRQTHAVGRVCMRRAERAGRCGAERREGLRGAWQRWLVLLLSERLGERDRERVRLLGAERGEAATRSRADGLAREMQQLRGLLATLQQRAATATATADAARADATREGVERSRAEVARRSESSRCQALEREVSKLQRARKAAAAKAAGPAGPPRAQAARRLEAEAEAGRAQRRAAVTLVVGVKIRVAQLAQSALFGRWRLLAFGSTGEASFGRVTAAPIEPSGWYQGLRPPR
jgi:hypothetical protein